MSRSPTWDSICNWDAAANFAHLFGEEEQAAKYRQAAEEIKEAALNYLWDEESGHFLRMLTVAKDGTITRDKTLDSSVCALFQFGMLAADDPEVERMLQALEQTLWAKTSVGGMARYENDYYYQTTHDLSQAQGQSVVHLYPLAGPISHRARHYA